jgi:hypothetical protein
MRINADTIHSSCLDLLQNISPKSRNGQPPWVYLTRPGSGVTSACEDSIHSGTYHSKTRWPRMIKLCWSHCTTSVRWLDWAESRIGRGGMEGTYPGWCSREGLSKCVPRRRNNQLARRMHETEVKRANECRCGLGMGSLDILTIFMVSFPVFGIFLKVERPKKLEARGWREAT